MFIQLSMRYIIFVTVIHLLTGTPECLGQHARSYVAITVAADGRILPGPDPRNPGQMFQLANSADVQQLLGIQGDLATQLQRVSAEIAGESRSLASRYRSGDITVEQRRKRLEQHYIKMQDSIAEALSPAQQTRLVQIVYRLEIERMGLADSLTKGRLSELIGVHENQKSFIRRRVEELTADAELKIANIKAELERNVLKTLTPEQRKLAVKAIGGYVDVSEPSEYQQAYTQAKQRLQGNSKAIH